MHNKGMVIDDLTVISSINWGDSAMRENREVGAVVRSELIASYFSSIFYEDWSIDPIPPVISLPWTYIEVPEGRPLLLDASASSDNASAIIFEWDIDGDGSIESDAASWAVKLPAGNHSVVLTVRDLGNNTVTATCWVDVTPNSSASASEAASLLLVLPLVFVSAVMAWKRLNGWKKH